MKLLLLLSLLALASLASSAEEDYCSQFNNLCQACIDAGNQSISVTCYYCGAECRTVDFQGLFSNRCELSQSNIWTCYINGLGVVILLSTSGLCVCCICCGFSCFLCLCCISACNKRRSSMIENEEVRVKLIGEERQVKRQVKRENHQVRTKLILEKYGQAV